MNNIYVDNNHSKCSLLDIIKHSNIDIHQPYLYVKDSLIEILISYLMNNEHEIAFYDPHYPFSNKEEFIQWLGRAPEKLSGADKQKINIVAKEIILFCKSGYDFNKSKYNTYEEVEEAVLKIKDFGTISYVRTAVKLFNLTRDVHNQIMLKKHYKEKCVPVLQVKYGKFKIDFD